MVRSLTLAAAILLAAARLSAQAPDEQKKLEERRAKIDQILRYQDTRSIHNGTLISLLTDNDKAVRERAARAFANIQDTSVMSLLVDRLTEDPDADVQAEAAFAIGQTAGQLGRNSRRTLQHDLIWVRLDKMIEGRPADRLIEEIGKFGTEEALHDLLQRFATGYPPRHADALVMSVARFAIRGIVSDEAVVFLERFTKPADETPWHVAYALQRIGNNPEIRADLENLAQLFKHPDPLVRMNIAALLGKVRDARICLEPLQKLADFDDDWRVRVNALKALANYDLSGKPGIIETFRRSFYHPTMYVALTALSSFGDCHVRKTDTSAAVRDAFSALERIALNADHGYLWQLQGEAALAAARLEGQAALALIHPETADQTLLQGQLLNAAGATGAPAAADMLLRYVGSDEPVLYRSALEGLADLARRNQKSRSIVDETYDAAFKALSTRDVAVVTTAAGILGDSLFLRTSSVDPLLEALADCRIPHDVEAIQEISATLGRLKDVRAVDPLTAQLKARDLSIELAAAAALKSITGHDYSAGVLRDFEPAFADFDFATLHALPDTVHVDLETIRGDIKVELYKNIAPFTIMSIIKLTTQRGFYRGLPFHRVVPNFVIQGGDPRGDGWGGPGYSIRSEFSDLTFDTGTIGIASAGKDTEGSQFFITQSPQPHLDGRYTIIGRVISGMDVVDKIQVDDHIFDLKVVP